MLKRVYNVTSLYKIGPETMYQTVTSYTYNQLWMSRYEDDYRFFRVRACSDVHVSLATYSGRHLTFTLTAQISTHLYNLHCEYSNALHS